MSGKTSLYRKSKWRAEIERSEFASAVEENNKHYKDNAVLYRKRQEINEHIFGTIKRKMGILLHQP